MSGSEDKFTYKNIDIKKDDISSIINRLKNNKGISRKVKSDYLYYIIN